MNQVIRTLISHRSIRKFTVNPISDEDLDLIIKSSQWAPSSSNGQQVTIICVKDKDKKEKIAELSGDQPWIKEAPVFLIFCSDFYRAKIAADINNESLAVTDSVDALLIGATDVGLSLGNAIAAAESLGLGTVPIGGVRHSPDELVNLLNLPQYVFPICGLAIGNRAHNSEQKPRLPKKAIFHEEIYNRDLTGIVKEYDKEIADYLNKRTNGKDTRTWSETISKVYNSPFNPNLKRSLHKQGYKVEE